MAHNGKTQLTNFLSPIVDFDVFEPTHLSKDTLSIKQKCLDLNCISNEAPLYEDSVYVKIKIVDLPVWVPATGTQCSGQNSGR